MSPFPFGYALILRRFSKAVAVGEGLPISPSRLRLRRDGCFSQPFIQSLLISIDIGAARLWIEKRIGLRLMLETGEFDVPAGWAGVRRQQEIARQNAQRLECAAEACRGVGLVGEEIAPGGDRVEAGAEHDDDTSVLLAGKIGRAHV